MHPPQLFLYYYYYYFFIFFGGGGSYTWAIPRNARNNAADRISFHTDSIYSFNHLVSIFWIWAPNNITLNLVIFYTGKSQANDTFKKKKIRKTETGECGPGMHSNNPIFVACLEDQNKKMLKLTSVNLPDQVPDCNDQPNPLEVQPCELERHKQESEGKKKGKRKRKRSF
jgi:hypothetical protein